VTEDDRQSAVTADAQNQHGARLDDDLRHSAHTVAVEGRARRREVADVLIDRGQHDVADMIGGVGVLQAHGVKRIQILMADGGLKLGEAGIAEHLR
jgi:hypothetical protein